MWLGLLLVFVLFLFLLHYLKLRFARRLADEFTLLLLERNEKLVSRFSQRSHHSFHSFHDPNVYADLISAFNSVFLVFSCMSFSDLLSRFLDKDLRSRLPSSVFTLYNRLIFSICKLHSSGDIYTLNGVLGYLDSLLEDHFKLSSESRDAFFRDVIATSSFIIPSEYVVRRDVNLSFKF